jgi:hypothetical protein
MHESMELLRSQSVGITSQPACPEPSTFKPGVEPSSGLRQAAIQSACPSSQSLAAGVDHWQHFARRWASIGAPLRPGEEDLAMMQGLLGPTPGHGLMLGVTPELTALSDTMVAVERDAAMIECQWRPRGASQTVRKGDWLDMPLARNSVDFAVGDGSLNVLRHAHGYVRLFGQLRGCLRDRAMVVLRIFACNELNETVSDVVNAATEGGIGSFHAFKARLAMAMAMEQGDPNIGVIRIRDTFDRLFPDRARLALCTGWPVRQIDTIDIYRQSEVAYSFPTLSQLRLVIPDDFEEIALLRGSYELAQNCPILALRLHK